MKTLPESNESLWRVIVSPAIWAAHFFLCYLTVAIWCAKWAGSNGTLGAVRWAIAIYTVIALIGIGWNGWGGLQRHRLAGGETPHDSDTPEDRHRFLGFSTLLLSALSAVATLFAGLVAIFFWNCD
ncbi:MAG: hypothetical protein AB1813_05165 [Verrucomicrobiota bacterium]